MRRELTGYAVKELTDCAWLEGYRILGLITLDFRDMTVARKGTFKSG